MRIPTTQCTSCGGTGKEHDREAIGKAFQNARLDARLKIHHITTATGYSKTYISALEHGKKLWNNTAFAAYTKALTKLGAIPPFAQNGKAAK